MSFFFLKEGHSTLSVQYAMYHDTLSQNKGIRHVFCFQCGMFDFTVDCLLQCMLDVFEDREDE